MSATGSTYSPGSQAQNGHLSLGRDHLDATLGPDHPDARLARQLASNLRR